MDEMGEPLNPFHRGVVDNWRETLGLIPPLYSYFTTFELEHTKATTKSAGAATAHVHGPSCNHDDGPASTTTTAAASPAAMGMLWFA